ncbi:MAG: hypothetical protein ABSH04_06960 [Acidimicrobiales bacterium]
MTIVVLLILLLVWAVVLGPSLLRRGAQRHSTDSIGAFHRQLRVLQHTGPSLVDPIHRLDASLPATHIGAHPHSGNRPGLIVVRPDAAPPVSGQHIRASSVRRPDPYFRAEACKRRREVLLALLLVVVCTGLLGAIPAARLLLAVTSVAVVALTAYVVLLVRLRNRALEREVKLRFLPQPVDRESSIVIRRVVAR